MKAIKTIMIIFAILGIMLEVFFFGMKDVVSKELVTMKTDHTSQICEVSEADGSYTYTLGDKTYSETECIDIMEKAKAGFDVLVIVQGALIGLYIVTAFAAGRSSKKRERIAQPALC